MVKVHEALKLFPKNAGGRGSSRKLGEQRGKLRISLHEDALKALAELVGDENKSAYITSPLIGFSIQILSALSTYDGTSHADLEALGRRLSKLVEQSDLLPEALHYLMMGLAVDCFQEEPPHE